ncbi:hypothetical protein ACIF70_11005 [Actinacidiphila glaucinigra]|uniref:hypothetical protein n=1 Tax=Actinacidiphila glaucinigra TaxID=235986 RepID=UPI0037CB4C6E
MRSPLAIVALVLLAATATACGSSGTGAKASPAKSAPAKSAPASADKGKGAASDGGSSEDGRKIDACTLLKLEEITPIIGENDGGHPDAGVGESVCSWENQDTYHSVTLSIGSPTTAGSEADGAESMMTAFTVGDRLCTLQVVTLERDADKKSEAELIDLVRTRV